MNTLACGNQFEPLLDQFQTNLSKTFAMRRISNAALKAQFLGWQCRIRQIAMRDYGGQPLPAMRPRVSRKSGEVLSPGMIVLLIPVEPSASTAFFRFQIQKARELSAVREAGIKYMSGDFYQLPENFSDELTAVFGASSELAASMLKPREVLLDFEQYSQSYRMFCRVRKLGAKDAAREASLCQARLFNPNISNEATVLGFKPDWKTAQAGQAN
jgi:hypothetical protein